MRNIRQNLAFAFLYNAAGVPIAAGRSLPRLRPHAVADRRGGGDVAVVGQRHFQRAEAAPAQALASEGAQRLASWSRIWVRRTISGAGGGGSAGAAAFGLRFNVLIPLITANSAIATITKLMTMVMKSP